MSSLQVFLFTTLLRRQTVERENKEKYPSNTSNTSKTMW